MLIHSSFAGTKSQSFHFHDIEHLRICCQSLVVYTFYCLTFRFTTIGADTPQCSFPLNFLNFNFSLISKRLLSSLDSRRFCIKVLEATFFCFHCRPPSVLAEAELSIELLLQVIEGCIESNLYTFSE